MNWLVEDAARLWAKIPSLELPSVIDQAIIEAAPYVATCPLVAKCWMDSGKKELNLGSIRMSVTETSQYLESIRKLDSDRATPEQAHEFVENVLERLRI